MGCVTSCFKKQQSRSAPVASKSTLELIKLDAEHAVMNLVDDVRASVMASGTEVEDLEGKLDALKVAPMETMSWMVQQGHLSMADAKDIWSRIHRLSFHLFHTARVNPWGLKEIEATIKNAERVAFQIKEETSEIGENAGQWAKQVGKHIREKTEEFAKDGEEVGKELFHKAKSALEDPAARAKLVAQAKQTASDGLAFATAPTLKNGLQLATDVVTDVEQVWAQPDNSDTEAGAQPDQTEEAGAQADQKQEPSTAVDHFQGTQDDMIENADGSQSLASLGHAEKVEDSDEDSDDESAKKVVHDSDDDSDDEPAPKPKANSKAANKVATSLARRLPGNHIACLDVNNHTKDPKDVELEQLRAKVEALTSVPGKEKDVQ